MKARRILLIMSFMLSALLPGLCAVSQQQPTQAPALDAIKEHIAAGMRDQAVSELNKFIGDNPKAALTPEAMMLLGNLYETSARKEEAASIYGRVSTEFPDSSFAPDALASAAKNYRLDDRPDDAVRLYKLLLSKYPDTGAAFQSFFDLSGIYESTGREDEAVLQLQTAANRTGEPDSKRARRELVGLFIRLKRYYEAESAAKKFLSADPSDDTLSSSLVKAYIGEKNYEQAIALSRRLCVAHPDDSLYESLLFDSYKAAGKIDDLIDSIDAEKKKSPDSLTPYKRLLRLYLWDNRSIEALNQLERIAAAQPDDLDSAVMLARLYNQNQWTQKAQKTLENILEKHPDFDAAWKELGDIYFSDKQLPKAMEAWKRAARFKPDDTASYLRLTSYLYANRLYDEMISLYVEGRTKTGSKDLFASELARLYNLKMMFPDALREYMNVLVQFPGDPESAKAVEDMAAAKESSGETLRVLAKTWEENRANVGVGMIYAEALLLNGNSGAAESVLDVASSGRPDPGAIYSDLARRLIDLSRYAQAASLYETGAAKTTGDKAWYLIQAGRNRISEGNRTKAVGDFNAVASGYSGSPGADEAVFSLATISEDSGDFKKARSLYSRLAADYPFSPYLGLALLGDARAAFKTGDFKSAGAAFEALSSNPASAQHADEILFYRAETLRFQLKNKEASKLYTQLCDQYPESRFVNDSLNRLLFFEDTADADSIQVQAFIEAEKKIYSGAMDGAEGMLKGLAVSVVPGPLLEHVRLRLAELLENTGRTKEAAEVLSAAADDNLDYDLKPSLTVKLAELLIKLRENEAALKRLQTVISADPRGFWGQRAREMALKIH